jgi:hypothetical protein
MACACGGLGVYVGGSATAYELVACPLHPLSTNTTEGIERDDIAAMRVDECLAALAAVRAILWPGGKGDTSWSPDTAEAVARCLAFLAPRAEDGPATSMSPDFFTRPLVRIQDLRKIEGEAALLGHVFIYGVMHHAWFVEVEERDGDQVAVDDPYNRLDEFQQLDVDAGRFQAVEVPGFEGTYVVVIYPAGA